MSLAGGRLRLYGVPALVLLVTLSIAMYLALRGDRVIGRVYIDGLAVGGWSGREVEKVLRERAETYLSLPVTIVFGRNSWSFRPAELGIAIDWRPALAAALGNPGQIRVGARLLRMVLGPRRLGLRVRISETTLIKSLQERVSPSVERPPRNALYDPASGEIVPEECGRRIDLVATGRYLSRAVLTVERRRTALAVTMTEPGTTTRDLASLRLCHALASYATKLDGSSPNRRTNVSLGAARINGILVRPGQVFSFNAATGPRDAVHGYRQAPEIVRQEFVPGVGGGVCQVASTLYNAVLLAGLPIVARSCHALPPGYVPLGRDATVYYPSIDFRFANPTTDTIQILAAVKDGSVCVSLIGNRPRWGVVNIVTRLLATLAPPLVDPGDPRATKNRLGAQGYRVLVTRIFGSPGRPTRVETISEDTYYPIPRVRGTGEIPGPGKTSTANAREETAREKAPRSPEVSPGTPAYPDARTRKLEAALEGWPE